MDALQPNDVGHHHYTEIGVVAVEKIRAARQVGSFVRRPVRLAHSFPRRRRGVGIKSSEHSSSSL